MSYFQSHPIFRGRKITSIRWTSSVFHKVNAVTFFRCGGQVQNHLCQIFSVYQKCLPLLIFPCTIKSWSSLLAPAHLGGPGKRDIKWLWCCGGGIKNY